MINCSMLNGISGVLALLSIAKIHQVAASGIDEAIDFLASQLSLCRVVSNGIFWPIGIPHADSGREPRVAFKPEVNPATLPHGFRRASWCSGAAGVAMAMRLAGKALNKTVYQSLSIETMKSLYNELISNRARSPMFCHGLSGILEITLRFAHATNVELFRDQARILVNRILQPFVFETKKQDDYKGVTHSSVRNPGLLYGTGGILLVLLAATTEIEPSWDRLFLLS